MYDSIRGAATFQPDDPRHKTEAYHPVFAQKQWWIKNTQDFPQQKNSFDCGIYVCAAALAIITKQPIQFNQGEIQSFRKQMALHLIDDKTTQSHVKDLRLQDDERGAPIQTSATGTVEESQQRSGTNPPMNTLKQLQQVAPGEKTIVAKKLKPSSPNTEEEKG